jgi:hypothetical protein
MAVSKLERQKREMHRALGRYVETFSHLIFQMRWLLSAKLADMGGSQDLHVGDLLLGHGSAQHVADAFFGMCRYCGLLDSAETNIANQLQNEVGEKITERNKLMHGDWWTTARAHPFVGEQAAQLVRFYPNKRAGDFEQVSVYRPEDLDAVSDRIFALRLLLTDFGRCALGLVMLRSDLLTVAGPGEYHVRDILIAENAPKGGHGGTVVRKGPRAGDVAEGPVYS